MTIKEKRHKPTTRPRKSMTLKARRLKVQKRRLVGLGVEESAVKKMAAPEVRALLKRPKKLAKAG
ncbi:MAG TPA: hypothetical protein PKE55_06640 [Kiritimatiellia bacterium]|nr:hypothetical protein [Kiritimatiellia bacterium]